jgi:lipopolysaccharide transport system ATP-binding protein
MTNFAVRVDDLGKQYRIGERAHHRNIREACGALITAPYALLRRRPAKPVFARNSDRHTFWALRHVSFELQQGEVLGIVGNNGAGKSTLLKILSRITEPTEGVADIRGRVRTLLEVGTGFHPELTGRENIFLNGAILGMKRAEIARKFDEIVSFAEIERFIDHPVKWYSSGMYTRLAFSVAAHLEPDVLIVDEVLAVGDMAFRRKCIGKMQEVGRRGRTVFFVSHAMPQVTELCTRAILIDGGQIAADGAPTDIARQYTEMAGGTAANRRWDDLELAPGSEAIRLRSVRVRHEDTRISGVVDLCEPIAIEIQYDVLVPGLQVVPVVRFLNGQGACLFVSRNYRPSERPTSIGRYTTTCWVPGNLFNEGLVKVTAAIATLNPDVFHVQEPDVVVFDVVDKATPAPGSRRYGFGGPYPGLLRPNLEWTTSMTDLDDDTELLPALTAAG